MVRITKVHTGTGDDGTTGLVDGSRRSKADLRLEAVGGCDEVNVAFGLVRAAVDGLPSQHVDGGSRANVVRVGAVVTAALDRIQSEVFDLGAELATPPGKVPEGMAVLEARHADVLLEEMDEMLEELAPLSSFVLPGGSDLVARLHHARVLTRRLERTVVQRDSEMNGARPEVLVYINRLSDWCFVLGRWCSHRLGEAEVAWPPCPTWFGDGVSGMLRRQRDHDTDVEGL